LTSATAIVVAVPSRRNDIDADLPLWLWNGFVWDRQVRFEDLVDLHSQFQVKREKREKRRGGRGDRMKRESVHVEE
jgi:hypothetical protein